MQNINEMSFNHRERTRRKPQRFGMYYLHSQPYFSFFIHAAITNNFLFFQTQNNFMNNFDNNRPNLHNTRPIVPGNPAPIHYSGWIPPIPNHQQNSFYQGEYESYNTIANQMNTTLEQLHTQLSMYDHDRKFHLTN